MCSCLLTSFSFSFFEISLPAYGDQESGSVSCNPKLKSEHRSAADNGKSDKNSNGTIGTSSGKLEHDYKFMLIADKYNSDS